MIYRLVSNYTRRDVTRHLVQQLLLVTPAKPCPGRTVGPREKHTHTNTPLGKSDLVVVRLDYAEEIVTGVGSARIQYNKGKL